ncbi:MAG: cell division protein ZapA [Elusimicrobiota bacterium]
MTEITQIRICRREYNIASDEWQPLYIKKLGELLDDKISIIEKETGLVDNYKLIILASLKILDKMLQLEEKKTGSNKFVEDEINKLSSRIDSIL